MDSNDAPDAGGARSTFTVDELLDDTMAWLYRIRMVVTESREGVPDRRMPHTARVRVNLEKVRIFADRGLECVKSARLQLASKQGLPGIE